MTDLKALTVKQPWAAAIINDGKDVENRSRPTNYRGRLFIHAGMSWSEEGAEFIHNLTQKRYMQTWFGKVIGWVDVVGCHHADQCSTYDDKGQRVYCTQWALAGHYHWVLANPVAIRPIPAKGKLGMWNWAATE
jgi:hypothetical protein